MDNKSEYHRAGEAIKKTLNNLNPKNKAAQSNLPNKKPKTSVVGKI